MKHLEHTYNQEDSGERAQQRMVRQILQLIEEKDISLHDNAELLRQISKLEILREIPEQLSIAASQILAFIFQTEQKVTLGKDIPDA